MRKEQRRFKRIPFDMPGRMVSAATVRVLDVSLKGALIVKPQKWKGAMGDMIGIEIPLDSGESVIRMDMRVAHIGAERIGLACEHIDLDSITHLRRLVELNLGDDELLHRELAELGQ